MNKTLKIVGVILGILILACIYFASRFQPATEFTWGLDFSAEYARQLGFDPKIMYLDILSDLKPKKIRLAANWDVIEPVPGEFHFQETDEFLVEAGKENVEVILALGKKLPRWPECHEPSWTHELSLEEQHQAELRMLETAVNHFKVFPAVKIWQVENEPNFYFGDNCPKIPRDFLKTAIAKVKSLDSRPVMVTDSGELGRWLPAATSGGDMFGTTMYRLVYNHVVQYWKYPLPPWFFHIKAGVLQTFAPQPIVGVELQAEPWFTNGVENADLNTQKALMNPKIFKQNTDYAKAAGFSDNYLWGVEWWYWMAQKHNDWGMWAAAKELLNK